jgi:hypothetical protein
VHVLVADEQAMVYLRPETSSSTGQYESTEIFGCTYKYGRSYDFGVPEMLNNGGSVVRETLTGTFAAYEDASGSSGKYEEPYRPKWIIVVRNLRNGRVLHKIPTGTPTTPNPKFVGIGPTKAIVVKSDGAVAWIVETSAEEGKYQVHAVDQSGSRVLASSPEIEPHSLALVGSTLYWTQGGKPSSAVLN